MAFTPDQVRADIELFGDRTRQYVFISSASAYQTPPARMPVTESTPLRNPFWQYSRDKIACEALLVAAYRECGFPATIVRPSHTYDQTLVPFHGGWTVPGRLLAGKPVIVHGDGTSLWTMTHHDDFARAFVPLLGHPRTLGEAIHITSDDVLTWNQIADTLAAALGVTARVVHVPSDAIAAADPEWGAGLLGDKAHSMVFDNAKIRSLVPGWRAVIPFEQGVREIARWYLADPAPAGHRRRPGRGDGQARRGLERLLSTATDVLAAARALADDVLFPDAMRVDRLDVLPVAHLDALAAAGLYGAPAPAEAGGLGLDLRQVSAVAEELASGCLATAFVWVQHFRLLMTLATGGAPAALRDRWLASACRGTTRGGIALAGLMPGPVMLRAEVADGGWRLDGAAPWVTGWGLIDLLLVVARGPGDTVVTLIMDATAQPGLTVTASGWRRSTPASRSGSASMASGSRRPVSPVRSPSTRPPARSPQRCGSTGRSRLAWPGGPAGCSNPVRLTASWPSAGNASTPRSRPMPPRWRWPGRRSRNWPSAPRRRWPSGTAATRSRPTPTPSGWPARRCSCWYSGRARRSKLRCCASSAQRPASAAAAG